MRFLYNSNFKNCFGLILKILVADIVYWHYIGLQNLRKWFNSIYRLLQANELVYLLCLYFFFNADKTYKSKQYAILLLVYVYFLFVFNKCKDIQIYFIQIYLCTDNLLFMFRYIYLIFILFYNTFFN
jgi:hypothetical protein